MSGAFIVVEGPDGVGKTSASKMLAEWLDAEWRCFPDRRTPIGSLIDKHLKGEWSALRSQAPFVERTLDPLVFQALQLANRVEVQRSIIATLATGRHVVCDRYWGSGYAYGAADGLDPTYVFDIQRGLLHPAVSLLLDVPLDVAIGRLKSRGAPRERYEGNATHMEEVARRYRELWAAPREGTGAWVTVDASGSVDEVQQRMRDVVAQVLPRRDEAAEAAELRVQTERVGAALAKLDEAVRKAPHAGTCGRAGRGGVECTCPRATLWEALNRAKLEARSPPAPVADSTELLREVFRREELNNGVWLGRDLFERIRKHLAGEG